MDPRIKTEGEVAPSECIHNVTHLYLLYIRVYSNPHQVPCVRRQLGPGLEGITPSLDGLQPLERPSGEPGGRDPVEAQ